MSRGVLSAGAALASLRLIGIEPLRADALDVASLERIAERLDLLKRKEFAAADAIRDALAVEGILLKDGRDEIGRASCRERV